MKINACYTDQNTTSLVESWHEAEKVWSPKEL